MELWKILAFIQKRPDDLEMSVLDGFDEGRNAGVI
jgi:hypothetical protein